MDIWKHLVAVPHDLADRIHALRERVQVLTAVPADGPGRGHRARKLVSR